MTGKVKTLKNVWSACQKYPGGRWLFSKLIKQIIPYSGSIDALVLELGPGYATIQLSDKRKVRNHLNSIHAIALLNLGELTSGLALNMGLKDRVRGIVTEINIKYFKKARGTLTAKCRLDIPEVTTKMDYWLETNIYNQENDIIATTHVCWRLAPSDENQSDK